MCPNVEYTHSTEKVRDTTTLDDEKYEVRCSEGAWDMTSVVVTALCNQLEAFASDLGDEKSR